MSKKHYSVLNISSRSPQHNLLLLQQSQISLVFQQTTQTIEENIDASMFAQNKRICKELYDVTDAIAHCRRLLFQA